ncbi:MAG: hypothetical protein R3212_09760, partial [Xanthomonadales bacterium]|nr:hypothetical protein [Xanthomonadales bacterium]
MKRAVPALLVAAIVFLAALFTWSNLRNHEFEQIARIAEAESYAARSQLVKNVDTMIRALHDVHIYWSTFGHLPRELWADDASIELQHFTGIELILWSDPERSLRYLRNVTQPVFDYRPNDEEWALYTSLLEKAAGMSRDSILGPYTTEAGRTQFEMFFVPKTNTADGTLVALIDTEKLFSHFLEEDSPGFAITVKAGETILYQRGEAGQGLPDNWTRSGRIENSLGSVWDVTHAPTAELAESMVTPAIDAVLYSSIAISVLMGLLLIESGRANSRAREAELAQAQLSDLNLDLERQVAARTAELEERSRDLVTITDSVSHDLRNPLNSMYAQVQLLEQQHA